MRKTTNERTTFACMLRETERSVRESIEFRTIRPCTLRVHGARTQRLTVPKVSKINGTRIASGCQGTLQCVLSFWRMLATLNFVMRTNGLMEDFTIPMRLIKCQSISSDHRNTCDGRSTHGIHESSSISSQWLTDSASRTEHFKTKGESIEWPNKWKCANYNKSNKQRKRGSILKVGHIVRIQIKNWFRWTFDYVRILSEELIWSLRCHELQEKIKNDTQAHAMNYNMCFGGGYVLVGT